MECRLACTGESKGYMSSRVTSKSVSQACGRAGSGGGIGGALLTENTSTVLTPPQVCRAQGSVPVHSRLQAEAGAMADALSRAFPHAH